MSFVSSNDIDFNISHDNDIVIMNTLSPNNHPVETTLVPITNNAIISPPSIIIPTKATGRKMKKKKGLVGCCSKNLTDIPPLYMKFSDLPSHDDDMVTIFYDDIESDVKKKDEFGFYYNQVKDVQIIYSVENDEKVAIRLDNLLDRGFPKRMLNEKSLTLAELEDFVDRHPNNNVKIIGAQTDVETEMSLGPSWTYRDSTKVKIFYAMEF